MTFTGHRNVSHHDGGTNDSWRPLTCGHCGREVSGAVVSEYNWTDKQDHTVRWLACSICQRGSVMNDGRVSPGMQFGPALAGLPLAVREAYNEARDCMGTSAYTAAELICRKILMHVAVDKGADEGKPFAHYVGYLSGEGYVTPPMEPWVDLIRRHGNESTHELPTPDKDRAEGTVMFTAELLRLVYEMDHMAKKYGSEPGTPENGEDAGGE